MAPSVISNPAIEADLNVASPFGSILELAFLYVDAEPPIVDGVLIARP